MDLQRVLIIFFLYLLLPFNPALASSKAEAETVAKSESDSNPGVAFVHGTRDHRVDAYGGYWKTDFIDGVTQGLKKPDNSFVVHCDFSHYMWHQDAADCVVEQLNQFIEDKNLTSVSVYTHSNGANVMRWIVSNSTYNSQYLQVKNKIKQIIATAPSSAGTALADEVIAGGSIESNLGWLLGYITDAVKQQRVGDMLIFNDELLFGSKTRPSLPVPFKVIVGTDVFASPFATSSYCNGYLLNTALKVSKLYLDDCADGFLNCNSQAFAGDIWFYDTEKTGINLPLNHNQSRHSCFGLGQILTDELNLEGDEV